MRFTSFPSVVPLQRRSSLLQNVAKEIDTNLTVIGLKIQQLLHFTSSDQPRSQSTLQDGVTWLAPTVDELNPPEDCSLAAPATPYSHPPSEDTISCAKVPLHPPWSSVSSLSCIYDVSYHSKDALLPASEPLGDPFYVRSKPSPVESDSLESLRNSSERAVYTRGPRVAAANSFQTSALNSPRPDRRVQAQPPSMTFLASLLTWRLGKHLTGLNPRHSKAPLNSESPHSCADPSSRPTTSSNFIRPCEFMQSLHAVDAVVHRSASSNQPSPTATSTLALTDGAPPQELSVYQIRFNTFYASPSAVLILCL